MLWPAARREYEYEARKRLYRELEPLIFNLVEHSENAYSHIIELANMARSGTLNVNLSMTADSKDDNYYLKATIYKLLLPMAVFRLMQRSLTLYDLQLEDYFRLQYILAKCLYYSCADDYYIALGSQDKDDHEQCLMCAFPGYFKHPEEKKEGISPPNHIVCNKLGINQGVIDNLANSSIKFDENDKIYRVLTFEEFEEKFFGKEHKKTTPSMLRVCEIFSRMDPNKMDNYPLYVLVWRIWILHAGVYRIMKELVTEKHSFQQHLKSDKYNGNRIDKADIIEHINHFFEKEEVNKFRWVMEDENHVSKPEITRDQNRDFSRSLIAVEKYLYKWLEPNFESIEMTKGKKLGFISARQSLQIKNHASSS